MKKNIYLLVFCTIALLGSINNYAMDDEEEFSNKEHIICNVIQYQKTIPSKIWTITKYHITNSNRSQDNKIDVSELTTQLNSLATKGCTKDNQKTLKKDFKEVINPYIAHALFIELGFYSINSLSFFDQDRTLKNSIDTFHEICQKTKHSTLENRFLIFYKELEDLCVSAIK